MAHTDEWKIGEHAINIDGAEIELGCKNVYKGDQNLAKLIDAYLYDGANWVNVNTGATA